MDSFIEISSVACAGKNQFFLVKSRGIIRSFRIKRHDFNFIIGGSFRRFSGKSGLDQGRSFLASGLSGENVHQAISLGSVSDGFQGMSIPEVRFSFRLIFLEELFLVPEGGFGKFAHGIITIGKLRV